MKMQKTKPTMTLRLPVALLWLTASLVWFFATTSAVYSQEMNCELRESDSAWDRFWSNNERFLYRGSQLVGSGDIRDNTGITLDWDFDEAGRVVKGDVMILFGHEDRKPIDLNVVYLNVSITHVGQRFAKGYIIRERIDGTPVLVLYFRDLFSAAKRLDIGYEEKQSLMSIFDDLICVLNGVYK